MSDCLKTNEIEAFIAGGLSSESKSRFEVHIASCSACRTAVDACRRDGELARGIQQAYETIAASETNLATDVGPNKGPDITDSIPGYQILHEIHRGGQGVVYKAVQLATKRTVALKVLLHGPYASARQQHRFEREIDLVASLQHPNIVTVYDSGLAQGRHYFAMEYIHGLSLDAYLSKAKLSIDATLRLFQKICSAVNAAHQRGIIHRDLKPGNIRIDAKGEPHILDFGLAKAAGPDLKDGVPVTMSGEFMGTLAYASPEQTLGDPGLVDVRTDIYSLGVILFEMLTGDYPYQVVGRMAEVLQNVAEAEPRRPSTIRRQINDEVETIVLQALAKEKERRYQTAEALARDVGHYLAGEPIDAKRDSTWYVLRKSLRRYYLAAGVVAVFVLVLATSTIALTIMYRNQSCARQEAESARASEAEQRALAEKRTQEATVAKEVAQLREAEAIAAREETQQRADELEIVTEFQQSMLSEIDAEAMGRALYDDLRSRVRDALTAEGVLPEESGSTLASFDEALLRTNATDVALKLVDEQVLDRAVRVIESDFADQPVVRAALQQAVANTYRDIGSYPSALPLQEAALRTRRTEFGDNHSDTLSSINSTGNLLERMGKFEEALPYYREALEGRRRTLGSNHPETLTSLNNMGNLFESMGKFEEAHVYFDEALEGRRRVLGNMHPDTLSSINNMGSLLKSEGKLAEAEPYFRQGLEGYRHVLGDEHPETLHAISNMGALLESQGKFVEAEPYYREALETKRRVLGDKHPDTLLSINNMGFLLHRQGKLAEAEPYYREGLEGLRRVLGNEHPNTLTTINNLGALLEGQGKLVEAEGYLREVLESLRRILGDEHPNTLRALNNVGGVLKEQGKFDEAEPYFQEAIEKCRRILGDQHPLTLSSISNMGALLESQGKYAEAEPYFREALETRRRVLGDEHPTTLRTMGNLASCLIELGQAVEGEQLAREAVDGERGIQGRTPWSLGNSLGRLGHALAALERFEEAEAALLEAYDILAAASGEEHEQTVRVIGYIVDLYEAWHVAEPDGNHDVKAAEWHARLPEPASKPAARDDTTRNVTLSAPQLALLTATEYSAVRIF